RFLEKLDPGLVDDATAHPEETRAFACETERAAGEESRVCDLPRDARCFPERLARSTTVGGLPLCVAASEEDLTALPLILRLHQHERIECISEVGRRCLVAERSGSMATGAHAVDHRLVGGTGQDRLAKMMRQRRELGSRVVWVELLQDGAHAGVQPCPVD